MANSDWQTSRSTIEVPATSPATRSMGRLFLTVNEAAERLGVTQSWIYERTR